jgi:hypothetical protein
VHTRTLAHASRLGQTADAFIVLRVDWDGEQDDASRMFGLSHKVSAGVLLVGAAFVGVLAAGAAPSLPRFGSPTTVAQVPWDGYLDEIGVADVTGDGKPDIVGVKFFDGSATETHPLVVLAGDGKGGFKDVTKQVFVGAVPRTQHARHIVFADFNRDGRMDFFMSLRVFLCIGGWLGVVGDAVSEVDA